MSTTLVWNGNAALRPQLVAVDTLRPHPRNPRRGVVPEIEKSLRRFGQQRPVLALPDGTLVAGHHVWRAAMELGWTHLASVESDLADKDVDAYLLADNRLADLGLYDDNELARLLADFADDDLVGVGYGRDDVAALLAYLDPPTLTLQDRDPSSVPPDEKPYALGTAELFRISLSFDRETYERVIAALDAVAVEHGFESYSETVLYLATFGPNAPA